MGQFVYKAVGRGGEHLSGTIEAVDRRSAVSGLSENGQFVIELTEGGQEQSQADSGFDFSGLVKFGSGRVSGKDILAMTSQLGTALRAGLELLGALEIIRDQQHKTGMRSLLTELVESVSSGQSLSEAMGRHERIFGPLYISMIRVGETGGILEQTTSQLAEILQRDEKIKTSMKNASAYPVFVLALGLASVVVVLTWILPNILATLTGGVEALPWPTRMLLGLSSVIRRFGLFAVIVIVAGGFYFGRWSRTSGKVTWDRFKLQIPLLGSVLRSIAVGRFARTLGALTKGGVTILESLAVVRDTLGNELLGSEIDKVAEKVKAGNSLAEPLGESGFFPPLLIQIVSVGEQTGKLDELLLSAAETFDEQADSTISRFIAVFPAILILLLALIIGFIIAATLLPIVMMQLGGGL
ncbi:type II secretion system F family protein [Planctomycetota bacterium]